MCKKVNRFKFDQTHKLLVENEQTILVYYGNDKGIKKLIPI